jgi:hypothetical protein
MAKIKAPKPHRWVGYKRTNNITLSNDKKEVIVYKQMFHNLLGLIFTLVSEFQMDCRDGCVVSRRQQPTRLLSIECKEKK